jgi:hypothetical protein
MRPFLLSFLFACLPPTTAFHSDDPAFVQPDHPVVRSPAISHNVENGSVYESGALPLPEGTELVLPDSAHVEEYDGTSIRFFLTMSLQFQGHPPHPMPMDEWRDYPGIATREADGELVVSTFGEWSTPEGSAGLQLLVLVPRGCNVTQRAGLNGDSAAASRKIDFNDPGLQTCYWYSGIGADQAWQPVPTDLNYNRFLDPQDSTTPAPPVR